MGEFNIADMLAKRALRVGDSAIRKMMMEGAKVQGALSLAQGIPESKTPLYIREGVSELLKENTMIGKYSLGPGLPELRKIVADYISKKGGFGVDPDKQICITAGAIEALMITIASTVEEGDEVILLDPGYPPYIPQVLFHGGKPVLVPLQADNDWKIDFKKLEAAVTPKTKAIIVCNPSNPTGMVMGRDELAAIASLAAKHGFFIIADLTYDFLVYDDAPVPSFLEFPEIRDRLIIVYSFSKEFSMTGWRSGYLYGPEAVVAQALKVHDMCILCAPTISQYAALVAFTKPPSEDHLAHHAEMEGKRDLMCERLDRLRDIFSYTKPRGAYYIIAKYKKPQIGSQEFAMRLLHEAKVIVVPGVACGSQGEGHVRFSYGASKEKINEAFDRIDAWAKTL